MKIVLGDRFGRSASTRLMTLAADVAAGHGIVAAQNHPYAGDHLIERHGRPESGMHAIQIEVDRSLYLDDALREPAHGLAQVAELITDIARDLAQNRLSGVFVEAAE